MSILVGYDESDASARALERAADEAVSRSERLIVLAVFELPLDARDPQQFGTAGDSAPITGPFAEPPPITDLFDDAHRLEAARVAARERGLRALRSPGRAPIAAALRPAADRRC